MRTVIENTEYKNGERVSSQTVYYSKSDDMFALASVQTKCAQYQKRIEQLKRTQEEKGYNYAEQIASLESEIALLNTEAVLLQEYLKGYGDENAEVQS